MLHVDPSSAPNLWLLRLLTFLLAALAAASASFWVLHWPATTHDSLNPVATTPVVTIDSGKVASLLGANPAAEKTPTVSTSNAYKLMGVMAEGGIGHQGARGSALISVEGALAKPFRVGDEVADGLVLQSVHSRSAVLGRVGQTDGGVTLELPLLPGMSDKP
jgi:general secretion pathway protein C